MNIPDFLTEDIGKAFVPTRISPRIRNYFLKAGITAVPYKLFGWLFWASVLLTSAAFILRIYPVVITKNFNPFIQFLAFFIFFAVALGIIVLAFISAIYFYVDMKIFNRTRRMEAVLQDFLRFVSENLRGGMSFERALWSAIRPEFDVLANEVRLVAKKVMTGQDMEEALQEFTEEYDSTILKRSFNLIIEGMKGGGKTADIIERIAENIEETKELKDEMATTNMTYVIFVTFIVILIAPFLFSLSYQFLVIIQGFSSKLGTMPSGSAFIGPSLFSNIKIKPETFLNFSRYAVLVTAFCSSLVVSMIEKGSIKGGIKYIPIFIVSSLIMFEIFMLLSKNILSGIFV